MPQLIPVDLQYVYRLFNVGGTSLVSAAYNGQEDIMPATWVCPLNIVPSRVTACIDSHHYTRPLIEKSGMFALALPTMSIVKDVLYLGSVSRNDVDDKLAKSGAKFFKMPGYDMPFVEGCACYCVFKTLPEEHIAKAYDLFIGEAVAAWADEESIKRLGREVDVILDCSDNFATRHAANRAALNLSKPLVTVSAIRYSLQVAFFDFTKPASACYACVFPEDEEADVKASQVGVLAPVTGFAGMIAAEEVLKWAAGMESLAGSMLVLDTLSWQMQRFALAKMPDCTVCAGR